ncbi:MAG: 50S ribosomal protein L11 methyltransferase [Pseudomonadota bacterium]
MTTWTALTTLTDQTQAQALAEALETLTPEPIGVGVFDVEDGTATWEVGAYFTTPPDTVALDLLAAVHCARPFAVSELPQTDWVAQVRRELRPIHAGRFYLYGSHDADTVPDGVEPLLIEAAMAFGTGHHGTTQGCLLVLEDLIGDGLAPDTVADVGCGTAVLAMAAARVWDAQVVASDIDPVAMDVAAANARANGLGGRLTLVTCAGFQDPAYNTEAPFDLIFANILKGPLIELAAPMAQHMVSGGYAILSGLLNEQADEVEDAYRKTGILPQGRRIVGEWSTLCLRKSA